jgi:NAD(P)-dependent dehydrogenase (short-subunit alcohol dehydrogenase family)
MAVVLVTGGSSGIGLATVRRLAAAGDRVFAASRSPERTALPRGVVPITVDLGQPDSADIAVRAVMDQAGTIDVVINNAGTGTLGPFEEIDDEEAHRIFEVNLFAPLRLARAVVGIMRANGGGRIINVTSMNDVLPAPFGGWYSASKAALASASAVLDAEVHGFGVFVTVVAPGLFRSDMSAALGSYRIGERSPYSTAFSALMVANAARLETAADPDAVATAIDHCIRSDDPPARIIVGDDAESMTDLVREASSEDLSTMLRDFVAELASGQPIRPR